MARTILFFALLFFVNSAYTQSLNWQWAKQYGGTGRDFGGRTAVDAAGNVYMVGIFTATINIGNQTLTSAGEADVFISKQDASGNIIWAKRYGGSGDEYVESIALSGAGNIYISGTYRGMSVFGSQTPHSSERVFLAKLSINGDLLSSRFDIGGRSSSFGSMAIDGDQNIILGGMYYQNLVFGADSLKASGIHTNPFLAKFDSTLNLIWMKSPLTNHGSGIMDVATDANNSIYITGSYGDTIIFDSYSLTNGSIFTVKYSASGNVAWAKNVTTTSGVGSGVAVDNNGNVFVTGLYSGATSFGAIVLNSNPSPAASFLVKYDNLGTVVWARHIARTTYTSNTKVVTNPSGNVFITGVFRDSILLGNVNHEKIGKRAPYIIRLDNSGNFVWGTAMNSGTEFYPQHISLGTSDEVYFSGAMQDSLQCGSTTLYGAGSDDIFLAKLSTAPNSVVATYKNPEVKLYPQPSTGVISLEFTPNTFNQIIIGDPLGRIVFEQKIASTDTRLHLNLAELPNGIYIAHFIGEQQNASQKIVINR